MPNMTIPVTFQSFPVLVAFVIKKIKATRLNTIPIP